MVCSVDCSFRVEHPVLDHPAAQLVDDRRLLDPNRADLDARLALHARPRRLRLDPVGADQALLEPERARMVGVLAQLEDHIARRQRPPGGVCRARLMTAPAFRARIELQQMQRCEILQRPIAGRLIRHRLRNRLQLLLRVLSRNDRLR